MSSAFSGQPKAWSLWIYDRHCTLIYHADWSVFHKRNTATTASAVGSTSASARPASSGGENGGAGGGSRNGAGASQSRSAVLPLAEQAKLVYGLVFSLRNMTRKISPHQNDPTATETLHSFSTATYTLAHLQTTTSYTFVMLTDPVQAPTRGAPSTTGNASAATFSGGGGIPATGGMTTTGVLAQIARGPWVEFVARNPGCLSLERQDDDGSSGDEDEDDAGDDDEEDGGAARAARQADRRAARQKDVQRQRMTGIGKSVDSEAFRAAVERVLAQNKLNAPRM